MHIPVFSQKNTNKKAKWSNFTWRRFISFLELRNTDTLGRPPVVPDSFDFVRSHNFSSLYAIYILIFKIRFPVSIKKIVLFVLDVHYAYACSANRM